MTVTEDFTRFTNLRLAPVVNIVHNGGRMSLRFAQPLSPGMHKSCAAPNDTVQTEGP